LFSARQGVRGKLSFMPASRSENVKLQERDVSLLVDLLESRVLSLDHIHTLHFPEKYEMAKKRVRRLKAAGYLTERPRRIGEPSMLHLTWKGYSALRTGGHVGEDAALSPQTFTRRMGVSAQMLAHELMIGDVKSAFTTAVGNSERFSDLNFDVWPRRYEFVVNRDNRRVTVKPDGHIRFVEKNDSEEFEYHYFFEADTGSETLDRVVEKCVNYRRGGYAVFCGGTEDEYKSHPFRVLVVCQSEKRRNNLAERLLQVDPPFSTMILLTTLADCVADTLGQIWMTAGSLKQGYSARNVRII
jgi:hypothetical protein